MSDTELDPFDPAFIACPFPSYEALRAGPGATWVPHGKGFWLITRHELVRRVAGDVGDLLVGGGITGHRAAIARAHGRDRRAGP